MYQNILQQLQQLFAARGQQPGGAMPRGPGGISDMMYRYPPGGRPSFIDGLMQPPAVAGLQPPTIGGELPPVTGGERPGTYGVPIGAPDGRGNDLPSYPSYGGYSPNLPGRGNEGRFPPQTGGPLPPYQSSDYLSAGPATPFPPPSGGSISAGAVPPYQGGGSVSYGMGNSAVGTPSGPGGNWPFGGNPAAGGERPGTYGVPMPGAGGPTNYPGIERPGNPGPGMPRVPTGSIKPPGMGGVMPKPMPMPGMPRPRMPGSGSNPVTRGY